MEWLAHLQWPAMVVTIAAAWFVASSDERRRRIGFWSYLIGNVLWVAWGMHTQSWALVGVIVSFQQIDTVAAG